jgi:hypothetical protein
MNRRFALLLPFGVVALGALATAACGSAEAPPPPPKSTTTARSAAQLEASIRHDVSWTAGAAKRCAAPGAGRDCASSARGVPSTVSPASLRPKGVVADVIAQLPIKEIVCAIARKYRGGSSSSTESTETDASVDAGSSADAGESLGSTFDMYGGRIASVGGGDSGVAAAGNADVNIVWDIDRCQAAVFIDAAGTTSLGTIASLDGGHRGPARGAAAGVDVAGSGTFVLDGATIAGAPVRVRKEGFDFVAELVAAASAPTGLPPVDAAFLDAHRTGGYVAWDAGTMALAAFPTGRAPAVTGADGARYVQYEDDAGSSTSCGAQMAVAKLVQSNDPGDFSSPAGEGALAAIASGAARIAGLALDAWCGDALGTDGGSSSSSSSSSGEPALADSCINHDPSEGFCRTGVCTVNGGGQYCCRPEPEGTLPCYGNDSDCPRGLVCTLKTDFSDPTTPFQVCARQETCSR